jgi:hypothetical protein
MLLQIMHLNSGLRSRLMPSIAIGLSLGGVWLTSLSAVVVAQTPPSGSDDIVVDTEPQVGTPQTPPTTPIPTTTDESRFACNLVNGEYTVMYRPESQPGQAYAWATPSAMGGGWSPDRRCSEISRRLESYRPDGLLEMRTSVENGYNTICVTTQATPTCRIVLTVPPGQDPTLTRDRVFQNLTIADSGSQTQAVNTYRGNGADPILGQIGQALNIKLPNFGGRRSSTGAINLRPFLDRADGGTAANLRSTRSLRSTPRLNPAKFR